MPLSWHIDGGIRRPFCPYNVFVTIADAINRFAAGGSLREREAASIMSQIMSGEATPAQIGALLAALRIKGERVMELVGFAKEMRRRAIKVPSKSKDAVDTCGTGGDQVKTFNLSTAAAFIASSAGAKVAKHGNRAFTSRCGSADVLEAIGVNLNLSPQRAGEILDSLGIVFLFAPNYHPAMKHVASVRKEIGIRTVFNLLGPLCNPAEVKRQVLGVYEPALVNKVAKVLLRLGSERAIVAYAEPGLDEISPEGLTEVVIVYEGRLFRRTLHPEDFGLSPVPLYEVIAKDSAEENARVLVQALEDLNSPYCRAAIPTASAALWVAGVVDSFLEGAERAKSAIRKGLPAQKLKDLIRLSQPEGA